jgi:Cu(I)/Ag(I) efflux system membrane protein CusA/SilA
MVTTTVEGRERFGVGVRYPRELRGDPQQIASEVLVPTMDGAMVPLGQVAQVKIVKGAPGIRTENALLSAYIFVDIRDRDIGGYVADAKKAVAEKVKFPPGYYVAWSGQFEYMERAIEKMKIVIPFTLLSIFLLLYLNFRRLTETFIVMLSVPFALVGGVWLMWLLNYNLSVAVAIGFIALAGVAAETGVVMLIYLDHSWQAAKEESALAGRRPNTEDLYAAVMEGAGRTRAAENDDRDGDHGRPLADHVGHRHRIGSHEPHRGADGGRHDFLDGAHARGDSRHLRAGQAMAPEAGHRALNRL